MALRKIIKEGDKILRTKSREVGVINDRIRTLIDDMIETMYHNNGAGLAAPQVGVLKRIVVIDVGDGLIEMINPTMVDSDGEQVESEGCLSIPGIFGEVKRPAHVTVEALDRNGNKIRVEGSEMLARAICHEMDHLDGVLFTDKVIRYIDPEESGNHRRKG
jgi:peptide deformylase